MTTTSLDTGTIYIKSNPVGADVFIDGEYYGPTPLRLNDTEPGVHTYVLKANGYSDFAGQISVEAGKVSPEFIMLSPGNTPYTLSQYNQNMQNQNQNLQILQVPTPNQYLQSPTQYIQTLQAPTPTPGYIIVPERTAIYVLGGMVIALLIYALLSKK